MGVESSHDYWYGPFPPRLAGPLLVLAVILLWSGAQDVSLDGYGGTFAPSIVGMGWNRMGWDRDRDTVVHQLGIHSLIPVSFVHGWLS